MDGTVRIWSDEARSPRVCIDTPPRLARDLAYSPDGAHLASGDTDAKLLVWEVASGREVQRHAAHGWIYHVAYSPDGELLVHSDGGAIDVRRARDGSRLWTIGSLGVATTFAIHPHQPVLVSGARDSHPRFWDLTRRTELRDRRGRRDRISDLVYSPDGRRIALCNGQSLQILHAETGESLLALPAKQVNSLMFSPDGAQIATAEGTHGGLKCAVRLWGRTPGLPWPPR